MYAPFAYPSRVAFLILAILNYPVSISFVSDIVDGKCTFRVIRTEKVVGGVLRGIALVQMSGTKHKYDCQCTCFTREDSGIDGFTSVSVFSAVLLSLLRRSDWPSTVFTPSSPAKFDRIELRGSSGRSGSPSRFPGLTRKSTNRLCAKIVTVRTVNKKLFLPAQKRIGCEMGGSLAINPPCQVRKAGTSC